MNDIDMIPTIGSSTVESIGYDESTQILRVRFLKGGLYEYRNFPPMEYEQLKKASSVGSYLAKNVKGKYPYDRIG